MPYLPQLNLETVWQMQKNIPIPTVGSPWEMSVILVQDTELITSFQDLGCGGKALVPDPLVQSWEGLEGVETCGNLGKTLVSGGRHP